MEDGSIKKERRLRPKSKRSLLRQRGSLPGMEPPVLPIKRSFEAHELCDRNTIVAIEQNADRILEEIGIDFFGSPEVLALWREAGARVENERVRFPKGLCAELLKSAPSAFKQVARNGEHSVQFGGDVTVFAPGGDAPFVRDLDGQRREATIEDFNEFVMLAHMSPVLHHIGAGSCEPQDVSRNSRHLDMLYAQMRYSDKPFSGIFSTAEQALDYIQMCQILFGEDFVEQNCVALGMINSSSPLSYDKVALEIIQAFAEANQAVVISPVIIPGATGPASLMNALSQSWAEMLAGAAYAQLLRRGSPVVMGSFVATFSMRTGALGFGTSEQSTITSVLAQLARKTGVPYRAVGGISSSKIPDAQGALETSHSVNQAFMAGSNLVTNSAGVLEGGLVACFEKFMIDTDQLNNQVYFSNLDLSGSELPADITLAMEPGKKYLAGLSKVAHSPVLGRIQLLSDNATFEAWSEYGSQPIEQRANDLCRQWLENYQQPELDSEIDAALQTFIANRRLTLDEQTIAPRSSNRESRVSERIAGDLYDSIWGGVFRKAED